MKQLQTMFCVLLIGMLIACSSKEETPDVQPTPEPTVAAEATEAPTPQAIATPAETTTPAPPPVSINIPEPVMLEGALATVAVSDVVGFCDKLSAMIGMPPETIKAAIGGQIGDPELTSLAPGGGIVLAALDNSQTAIFVEVNPGAVEQVRQNLMMLGLTSELVGETMVASLSAEGLATGKQLLAPVKTMLAGVKKGEIEVVVNMPKIVERYGPEAEGLIQTALDMLAQQQALAAGVTPEALEGQLKILEAEMHVVLSMFKQVKTLSLKLGLQGQGVLLEKIVIPNPGSNLAALFNTPAIPFADELMNTIPANGAMRVAVSFDADAMMDFIDKEARAVMEQMAFTGIDAEALLQWMQQVRVFYGDNISIDMLPPEEPFVNGSMAFKIKSPEGALEYFKTLQQNFEATGMAEMMKNMGQEVAYNFTENVGEHNGVTIHRLLVEQNYGNLPPEQAAAMQAAMGEMNFDMAFIGDVWLYAMGPQKIEELIDALQAGRHPAAKPLVAQQAFGPGAQMYFDLDVGKFLQSIEGIASIAMPLGAINPLTPVVQLLSDSGSITAAVFIQQGRQKASLLIPASLIARLASF